MPHERLLRLIELASRDLGATDARAEVGGRDPEDPRLIWCKTPTDLRIVLVFDSPPDDRAEKAARLQSLVTAFSESAEDGRPSVPVVRPGALRHRLDDALDLVKERSGALAAAVIDATSPEVWGTSEPVLEDVETAVDTARLAERLLGAGVDAAELLSVGADAMGRELIRIGAPELAGRARRICESPGSVRRPSSPAEWRRRIWVDRAIARVRSGDEAGKPASRWTYAPFGLTVFVRPFAGIYRLVLAFDGALSELKVEGSVARILPHIERLVTNLPPTEPPKGTSKSRKADRPRS